VKQPRVGFVTIGQSPRIDVVPGMLDDLGRPVEAVEAGVLDGLSEREIAALAPQAGEYSFASRLCDGRQVVLSKRLTEERLAELMLRLDRTGLDVLVALCTGTALPRLANTLVLEPQRIVDNTTAALAGGCNRLGIVLPLERQLDGFHMTDEVGCEVRLAHASPYEGDRFGVAGRELAHCDLIVMHCMGYGEAMRAKVAAETRAPVLLSNRMVAMVLRQLL
jgi:protein AroM